MDKVVLTKEEKTRFLSTVSAKDPDWALIFHFVLLTGLRAGEFYALTWEDVGSVIRVSKSYNHKIRKIKEHTKTKTIRFVPINWQVESVLERMVARWGKQEFICPRNPYFEHGEQSKVVAKYCKEAGVPKIRFHDLRAMYATSLFNAGLPLTTVMQICGWARIETAQKYLRLSGEAVKDALKAVTL